MHGQSQEEDRSQASCEGQKSHQLGKRTFEERETSQAERAAMHPDRSDLEWGYYHTAWSH